MFWAGEYSYKATTNLGAGLRKKEIIASTGRQTKTIHELQKREEKTKA